MQQIVNFIIRNKTFLLFLLLFSISLLFTIQSHSYHKSRFINSANFLTGGIYNTSNSVSSYFGLKEQNQLLQQENNELKSLLYNTNFNNSKTYLDSTSFNKPYKFTPARVIKNSYALPDNVLLLNRGKRDSITEDFGVISSKGLIGITDNSNSKFTTVISILNTTSRISAQLKHTNHFGSLIWNSNSPEFVQLTEIPQKAPVKIGDTIITSGRSAIFPKGIPIGTIGSFNLDQAKNFYQIDVKLFNDMTNIEHVYIIQNTDKKAIESLLNQKNE
ncbi:rod shape-determining protein MreC [Lacinutrix salivirga]